VAVARRFAVALLFALGYCTHCCFAQPTANGRVAADAGFSPAGLTRITDAYRDAVDHNAIPGAVLLLALGDRIRYLTAIGYRDRAAHAPMTDNTLFRIASMTKPITAVAAMILVEQKRLDLDAPVARYLPEFADEVVNGGPAGTEPPRRPITVRDLLRHTAGLGYGPFAQAIVARAYRDPDARAHEPDLAQLVDGLARAPLRYQPGDVWEYSISYEVLGRLIEVVSGEPLDVFIADRITRPLGMTATGFFVDAADRPRLARFQPEASGAEPPVQDVTYRPRWLSAGGGLVSTAEDYWRFCEMLLGGGQFHGVRILSPESIKLMSQNSLPPGIAYGVGTKELADLAPTPKMDQGFGLGFAVRISEKENPLPGATGMLQWYGALGTSFWIDPRTGMIGVQMLQLATGGGVYRRLYRRLAYDALAGHMRVAAHH
jgi:CubicO group peptidase (beta-lactamase class C family)